MPPYKCEHPAYNCYKNHGCRCEACVQAGREYRNASYAANREAGLASRRKWAERHPENARERHLRYNAAPHGKARARAHNRRARQLGAEGRIPPDARARLGALYGELCLGCGADAVRLEIDHVVPLAKGGTNLFDNLQLLCRHCNARKWTRTIDYRPALTEG